LNRKILAIGAAAAGGAALVAGTIVVVTTAISASTSSENLYQASNIHDLWVVQEGASSYDISFAVPEDLTDQTDELELQFTPNPDYQADLATDIAHVVEAGRIELPTTDLAPGDHFLWLTAGDERIAATITIPDMSPRIWVDNRTPTIEFDQSGDSSWSSYVDPEGKNVYESASTAFDDSAVPIAENLAITETSFRVDHPKPNQPYYYLLLSGRGGDATFVTAPLFAKATQGDLTVDIREVEGVPTYVIDGSLASRQGSDVERTMTLRVGNFVAGNPKSTFFVQNTATGGDSSRFHFEVPAEQLAQGYNDLVVFLTEDGQTLEWSLDATKTDVSRAFVSGQSVFGFRRPEALQLTRVDLVYDQIAVSLVPDGDSADLRVSGSFIESAASVGYQLVLKDNTGEKHVASDASSSPRLFSYSIDLAQLDQPAVWYDVEFLDPKTGKSVPISTLSVGDMRQWVATDNRTYAFAEYDGLLKVFFDTKPFVNSHVELATVNGVPSLVATGELVGIGNSSASLRIRTGDEVIASVANSSSVGGQFRFVFPLNSIPRPSSWFDVAFRDATTGTVHDFPASAATLSQTLVSGQKSFGFREFNGQLKVTYDVIPGTVNFTTVSLVDDGGAPILRLDGTLAGLSASDAFVRIRTGAESYEFPNISTTPGQARFDVMVSALTTSGTWYDVLVGSRSAHTLVDVPSAGVDLSQALTLHGHAYGLHTFNGQLKVSFDDVSTGVTAVHAEVVDVSGTPTLRVTGSVTGTSNSDVFLRIRSGAQTITVPNTAAAAGDALFEYDLSGLTQAGTWYDLLTGTTSTGVLADLDQASATLTQSVALGGRTYGFHEYGGNLKVSFDNTPVTVSVSTAELVDLSGVPTLRVTASYSGTTSTDVFLRVRTSAQTVDVVNTSTTAGQAVFDYDLSGLTQAGSWYDLLVGVTSSGQLVDLTDSVASMSQTIQVGARDYAFREYNHDLKVTFSAVATAFTIDGAEIVDASGGAVLRVTGTTVGLATTDVFLRIRSGGESFSIPNASTTAGIAEFSVDLSDLTQPGAWYDVLAGVTPSGSLTDISESVADLAQTVDLDGRHYAFHGYNGMLKVSYDDVSVALTVNSAQFAVESGRPVLKVTGTVSGTGSADAFVRISTGAQSIDVPNSATTAGQGLFVYDLSGITELDTPYDLSAGITSTGSLQAIPSTSANVTQTLSLGGRLHSFRDSSGSLRVYVETAPSAVDVNAVEIISVGGIPTLRVSGPVTGLGGDADVFLRISGGSTSDDIANSSTVPGSAVFEYPLGSLATGAYDLRVGETSTGGFASIDSAVGDLSQVVGDSGHSYGLSDGSGKLRVRVSDAPVAVSASQAQIVTVSGVPTLRVTGTISGTGNADAFLRIRTGAQTVTVPNTATVNGLALFEYDLRGLTQLSTWYDVLVGITSTSTLTDLTSATANMSQTAAANARIYGFREWSGALKVTAEQATVGVSATQAEIVDVAGVPTLRVTGTFTNTNNADMFLRIRTSDQTVDVPNTATTAGQFRFAYDLAGLTKPGTWYDLLVGATSTGALTNLTPAIANMSQTITISDRAYSFKQYNSQLKVNYDDVSVAVAVSSAQLIDVSGTPTLRVTGSITNTANSDVYLRIRTGSTVVDVSNSSSTPGQFSADYAVAGLNQPGVWYDVLIGILSRSSLTDVPSSSATLSQTLAKDGRTYGFQQFNGDLKATYSETRLGSGQSVRIDFGPNDTTNGNATVSPDANGKYWNNVSSPNVVTQNLSVSGLRTTTNVVTTTKVTMTGTNWLTNGIATGGLLAPSSANLGDFAVATATQDYFFVQSSGTASMTLSGLNPYQQYDLRFFGTRQATDARNTTYSALGVNGTKSVVLQTTGTGIGAGGYNGNNNKIVDLQDVQPQADGTLVIQVKATAPGTFGYLGILEITGDQALTPPVQTPAEVSRWVAQDAADALPGNSVLFVGSSSVRRWESLTRDFSDYNIIQRGWGGAHLSGVNDYAPWVVQPYHPSAIVMWAGTNDIRAGKTPQTVLADFRTFVANVKSSSPATEIFWISITPTPGTASWDSIRQQTNALIQAETMTDPKLHYIDIATTFEGIRANDPTLFHDLYVDDLHLSRDGYARWLQIVRPALEAVVPPNKSADTSNGLQVGEKLLFDFGPSNSLDGDVSGTDAAGNRWNNWYPTTGGGLVNVGEHVGGLVTTTGRSTHIGMTITGGFLTNGKRHGGLLAPSTTLLGDLGAATATEDYFFSSADNKWGGGDDDVPGGFMLTGLDPSLEYEFRFFGSRESSETRITEYAVYGTDRRAVNLQTSGAGIGSNGTYNGNDDEVAAVTGVHPDAYGQVWIDVTLVQGSYAHLNAMEVIATPPVAAAMRTMTLCSPADEMVADPGDAIAGDTAAAPTDTEQTDAEQSDAEQTGAEQSDAEQPAAGDGSSPSDSEAVAEPCSPEAGGEPAAAESSDGAVADAATEPSASPEPTPSPEPTHAPDPEPAPTPTEPAVVPSPQSTAPAGRRRPSTA